jgi:hypothetical protein
MTYLLLLVWRTLVAAPLLMAAAEVSRMMELSRVPRAVLELFYSAI